MEIIKDDAKAIVQGASSKWFIIVGIETAGNSYYWKGNGFEIMDDDNQNGFMPMNVVANEKAIGEFNKACLSAEENMKGNRLFKNGGEMKITPLPNFLNSIYEG